MQSLCIKRNQSIKSYPSPVANNLKDNPNDEKIKEIAQDELNHVQELNKALSMLNSV